jgi:hypothetical protein
MRFAVAVGLGPLLLDGFGCVRGGGGAGEVQVSLPAWSCSAVFFPMFALFGEGGRGEGCFCKRGVCDLLAHTPGLQLTFTATTDQATPGGVRLLPVVYSTSTHTGTAAVCCHARMIANSLAVVIAGSRHGVW